MVSNRTVGVRELRVIGSFPWNFMQFQYLAMTQLVVERTMHMFIDTVISLFGDLQWSLMLSPG